IAKADVANAEAVLRTARIDLGYTEVRAPISGVTGLRAVSNGNLVTAGTLLTTIRQLDPMHVLFSMPELDAIALGRRSEEHTSELQSLMRNSYAVFCLKK